MGHQAVDHWYPLNKSIKQNRVIWDNVYVEWDSVPFNLIRPICYCVKWDIIRAKWDIHQNV